MEENAAGLFPEYFPVPSRFLCSCSGHGCIGIPGGPAFQDVRGEFFPKAFRLSQDLVQVHGKPVKSVIAVTAPACREDGPVFRQDFSEIEVVLQAEIPEALVLGAEMIYETPGPGLSAGEEELPVK